MNGQDAKSYQIQIGDMVEVTNTNSHCVTDSYVGIVVSRKTVRESTYYLVEHDGRRRWRYQGHISYVPTAEQIAIECAKIRLEWGPVEERKRRGVTRDDEVEAGWTPNLVHLSDRLRKRLRCTR